MFFVPLCIDSLLLGMLNPSKEITTILNLSNRPQFLGVYRRNKPPRHVGRTQGKKKVFECSPNIPRGLIAPVNPWKVWSIANVWSITNYEKPFFNKWESILYFVIKCLILNPFIERKNTDSASPTVHTEIHRPKCLKVHLKL